MIFKECVECMLQSLVEAVFLSSNYILCFGGRNIQNSDITLLYS
jgi:hypothetical protein